MTFASSPLNYSSPNHRYVFNITATQSFPNRPSTSSTAIAQINLLNCNVNAPLFIPISPIFSISETTPVGSPFGTVFATDADGDSITFAISPPSSQFSIDGYSGVLVLDQAIQTITSIQLNLTITATDDASSCSATCPNCIQLTSSTTVTISIVTANAKAPRFLTQICGSSIPLLETSPPATNITMLSAFDDDLGNSGQIVFSFPPVETQTIGTFSNENSDRMIRIFIFYVYFYSECVD